MCLKAQSIYLQQMIEHTLELDLIVSEVMVKKYKNEDNLIIEIELARWKNH